MTMSIDDHVKNLLRNVAAANSTTETIPFGRVRFSKEGRLQQEVQIRWYDSDGLPHGHEEWRDVPTEEGDIIGGSAA
jgi:hypothetical protein